MRETGRRWWRGAALSAGLLAGVAAQAAAQVAVEAVRTADGLVLELPQNGAWRARARQVAERRAAFYVRNDFRGLNAAVRAGAPTPAPTTVAGTIHVPAVLFGFRDTDTNALSRAPRYDSLYFGLTPPSGRPYSLRTLYREMSSDLLDVQGTSLGWVLGDSAASFYLAACGANNTIDCSLGRTRLHALFRASLGALDPTTDFGRFDNDGPDGIPNSGDDDGFVDVVQFVQPVVGGECGGPGVWAHRWFLSALGGTTYVTGDVRAGGGSVQVNSYYIGSGVGGAGPGNRSGCANPAQISGIGTMAHELGHAIGLPDLYDISGVTEGIGEWGLMGSGAYTSAGSPTHFEAWSKERLGWVVVVPATASDVYGLAPVVSRDTVLLVRPPASTANPRGEYFLLENRQPIGADTANMNTGGNAGPKLGGLLIWHVDSLKLVSGGGVNAGSLHAVALVQADGLRQLDLIGNRGDAGDAFPGTSGRRAFSDASSPPALLNTGAFAGFVMDSIRQLTPGGAMGFDLAFGFPLRVATIGPGVVRSQPATPPDTMLAPGEVVRLTAVPDSGALFLGWSGDTVTTRDTLTLRADRSWSVSATFVLVLTAAPPAPQTAVMGASYQFALPATGGTGTYSWVLLTGTLPRGVALKPDGVVAGIPEETGSFTATVQVTSGTQRQAVPITIAVTAPTLATPTVLGVLLGTGGTLTADERRYLDLLGNRNGLFDVGDFHAFITATGGAVSAEAVADLVRKGGGR